MLSENCTLRGYSKLLLIRGRQEGFKHACVIPAHFPATVIGMLGPPPPDPEELSDPPEVAVEAPVCAV